MTTAQINELAQLNRELETAPLSSSDFLRLALLQSLWVEEHGDSLQPGQQWQPIDAVTRRGISALSLLPPMPRLEAYTLLPDYEVLAEIKALGWIQLTHGDIAQARLYAAGQWDSIPAVGWIRAIEACRRDGIEVTN